MKRTAILLTALAMLGCEQANPVFERPAEERTLRAESFRGTVVLYRLPGSSDVVAAVDEAADGRADVAFVLQRGFAAGGPEFTRLAGGRIEADGSSVRVTDAAGRRVASLFLASEFPADVREMGIDRVVLDRAWTGFGLARRTGGWKMPDAGDSEAAAALARCSGGASLSRAPSYSLASVCASGGEGSTACSMDCPGGGGCSVKCQSGYTSCCDKVYCTCTCTKQLKPSTGN